MASPKVTLSPLQCLQTYAVLSLTGAYNAYAKAITLAAKILVLAYKALFGNRSDYLKELLLVQIYHEGL